MTKLNYSDYLGKKYGKLTILDVKREHHAGQIRTRAYCQCGCGNKVVVDFHSLRIGRVQSCGCIPTGGGRRAKNLVGKRFGKLVVLARHGLINGKAMWLCQCDCGNTIITRGYCLLNGESTSCGCNVIKHGKSDSRIYKIYTHIKGRCFSTTHDNYHNYGGRGITICDEWLDKDNGFMNFYNWAMENGYSDDLTIDRIDVNGNYEPSNCRWATRLEQANNKRNSTYVTYKNETHTITEWARKMGFNYGTLKSRLNSSLWTVEEAFETNVGELYHGR